MILCSPELRRERNNNAATLSYDIHCGKVVGDEPSIPEALKCAACGRVARLKTVYNPEYHRSGSDRDPLLFKITVEQRFEYLCACQIRSRAPSAIYEAPNEINPTGDAEYMTGHPRGEIW